MYSEFINDLKESSLHQEKSTEDSIDLRDTEVLTESDIKLFISFVKFLQTKDVKSLDFDKFSDKERMKKLVGSSSK